MKFKRCALLFILLSCLVLSGCGGPESTYKSAQALLAKGEYAKAGEKFESIGSYEDAATLTMYCKACALCESGDYEAGLKVLATLGGYKDSLYRITYYTARSYEDIAGKDDWECMLEAQDIYKTIPVFLDSDERITALGKRVETAKKSQYDAAVKAGESGDFSAARRMFDHLGSYSDSKSRYTYYGIRADEIKLAESMDESAVSSVATRYTQMGAYLDCEKRAASMADKVVTILDNKYDAAVALMKEGKYTEAIVSFRKLGGHKDSTTQIAVCETAILNDKYNSAVELMSKGEYNEAKTVFEKLNGYKDSIAHIATCETAIFDKKYDAAVALMNEGKYVEAYNMFASLNVYKDSIEKANAILQKYPVVEFQEAVAGDFITFGTYEQDGNTANGKERIEWLVLVKRDNCLLVVSRYMLDAKPYNKDFAKVTWETCTLRQWLNKDFSAAAFSATEQAMIHKVAVSGNERFFNSANPSNVPQDMVFILNTLEASSYLTDSRVRMCQPTAYAMKQGAFTNNRGFCEWWVAPHGKTEHPNSAYLVINSVPNQFGLIGVHLDYAVRPALWINLEP